jgi:hypothetical protein
LPYNLADFPGVSLKPFYGLILLALSLPAVAGTVEDFSEKCQTNEIQKLMGENGSCRVVIVPKKMSRTGECEGNYLEKYHCNVKFNTKIEVPEAQIYCHENSVPYLELDTMAEGASFEIVTLIQKSDQEFIRSDKTTYNSIITDIVDVQFTETGKTISSSIQMKTTEGSVPMTNVSCR